MTTQTGKIKNGAIVLPRSLRKAWQKTDVLVFTADDTLIIKKVQKPLGTAWQEYGAKLARNRKKIPSRLLNEAARWAKSRS